MTHRNCKTCEKEFEIRPEDLVYYEQIQVPVPEKCPDCRMIQRLSFRNERTLYRRACDLCKKEGVSLYPDGTPFPVYCHKCWWGDGWDPSVYAMDYDKTKPFLSQFAELKNKVPRISLLVIDSINSDYTNNAGENKNCYLIFAAESNEDCAYSRLIMKSRNILDCCATYESELSYELVDCKSCFKCLFSERCQECAEVLFSFDMKNCQNCILCTNGRNLNYCIENVQCTKEEYEKKKNEILASYQSIEEAKKKYVEIRNQSIVKYSMSTKCNKATGDYIYNCHDGVNIFDARNSKNSSYIADAEDPIDCQDCNNLYFKPERLYNVMGTLQSNNCVAGVYIMYCNEVHYSDSCYNCTNCFGSAGLNKKNYFILNKEYSKEEYEKVKKEIISQMRTEGVYGEFFPPSLSPFGFNETLAKEYSAMTKDEALLKGFRWQNQLTGTYGKETIKKEEIPNTIEEIDENILQEVFVCEECEKNFRITKMEFDFYKRMNLPIPHKDFECRHKERMVKRNPRKLWHRKCAKENCTNEFETAYAPDRPEIIYCETCYQKEIY